MLSSQACQYEDGDIPQPEKLGKRVWDVAYPDIRRLNEVLDIVASYNYYLTIDDVDEAENYKRVKLNNPKEITIANNTHQLIYGTDYGTTYNITIDIYDDKWEVLRTGGKGFKLTVKFPSNGWYSADIEYIYSAESVGYGEVYGIIRYAEESGEPELSITGKLVMVDNEESRAHPLTITTEITEAATFDYNNNIKSGTMKITAEDTLYGSKDEIVATVMKHDEHSSVVIEYLDTREGYYL